MVTVSLGIKIWFSLGLQLLYRGIVTGKFFYSLWHTYPGKNNREHSGMFCQIPSLCTFYVLYYNSMVTFIRCLHEVFGNNIGIIFCFPHWLLWFYHKGWAVVEDRTIELLNPCCPGLYRVCVSICSFFYFLNTLSKAIMTCIISAIGL